MTFNDWIQQRWRPITAIVYLVICIFDFIIFPVLWSLFLYFTGAVDTTVVWTPLTLQGAGMFHLSFGAILGVSAFTRGQEKVRQLENDMYRPDDRGYGTEDVDYVPEKPTRRFEPPVRHKNE